MNKDKIEIIYEDENILAINKPSGLVVHPDGKTTETTLVDWILKNYPEIEDVGEPLILSTGEIIKRPGIVHRLDRETSGILLIAKNQKTFLFLKEQFKERAIKKSYRAFVYGEMKMEEGIVDRPIGRSNKDFRMWSAQRGARGQMRTAVTEYNVLERGNGFSFVEANPKTGRTHQIRVHFKAINHPIVSDSLYAPKKEKGLGFERLALHSYSIEFSLPEGKKIKLEAELPPDFKKALKLI
ncbi:TPA: RluA family pseudouridine synthase [Candidatus Campbellbacteria bacterium]|nr:MAG: ribosomal large subunit pseudouridine synthase D, 23S rRNA pseudouridine1911/1915/1917 synthase [Candidatus Campbellbacteria bacterium GW2011_OD1_34_28]KKP75217.1 MAG: Pseudouridine synthase, RluA family [Candidatus Campbellbacteria bacterium GW2011_GWD2_35_24]KKP76222.1 MAG: Pseudouridine synthase, RluA family [Candidatus Campbellbacteria bacterium GW2011_GWC2_35_28]KKP77411.1 MAG: Pseudouridine synthase, RluA family [Candidatus Campbellbacteria bacterium GW2011_GWC1_35_31]KKP79340.1 M